MSAWERACAELAPYIALDDQRSDPLAWWHQHAQMERARLLEVQSQINDAQARAGWSRECAVVALRMLHRTGKLKATTDDERKVLEWAEHLTDIETPGARRKLGSPFDAAYEATADAAAQASLFDTTSQESVEEAA